MTTTPFAATLRDKENYVDLTGLAKMATMRQLLELAAKDT